MFPRIEYLHWIDGRTEDVTYDLATSDLRGSAAPGGVVPDRLEDLPDPETNLDLDERVAAAYGVGTENVLVTPGATMANAIGVAAALSAAGERADERRQVLVEKPGYEPLLATPEGFGARVDRFRRPPGEEYDLEPDRVAAAARDDLALVTVTNRHNPSGRLVGRERLAATAEVVAETGGRLLVDEVYAPMVADPRDGAFGGVTAAGLEDAVVTGSLTKFHGLGGLRVGWLVADDEFVATARQVAYHFGALASPSTALAGRALANRESLERRSRELLRTNHAELSSFVEGRDDVVGEVHPGSTYAFLGHEVADGDEVVAAAQDRGLLVVPGRFFDDHERFRVSLGRDPDHVSAALSVLGEVLDAI